MLRFASECDDWRLTGIAGEPWQQVSPENLPRDGVIGFFAEDLTPPPGPACPVINVSDSASPPHVTRVIPDNPTVGRLAAEYLIGLGLQRLACFSGDDPARGYARHRAAGFIETVRGVGREAEYFGDIDGLERFLDRPSPTGVFATSDTRGCIVTRLCAQHRWAVPDHVAVMGVNNDELVCALSHPALTSVDLDLDGIGYLAAQTLDRLIRGKAEPGKTLRVPPLEVLPRASTAMFAIDDPHIAAAVRLIRDRVAQGITVNQILDQVPVSRRTLETGFMHHLGHTPLKEIIRTRIERAQQLLTRTEQPILKVAHQCGFKDQRRFATVFGQHTGQTPTVFRRTRRPT